MKEIKLSHGLVAFVDDDDYDMLSKFLWHPQRGTRTFYASANFRKADGKRTKILMHRLILGLLDSEFQVDHIDSNGLNNIRSNMRICSSAENNRNRRTRIDCASGYKGVYKYCRKWRAVIWVNYQRKHLGSFDSPEAAHAAYQAAAEVLHGEFARSA